MLLTALKREIEGFVGMVWYESGHAYPFSFPVVLGILQVTHQAYFAVYRFANTSPASVKQLPSLLREALHAVSPSWSWYVPPAHASQLSLTAFDASVYVPLAHAV